MAVIPFFRIMADGTMSPLAIERPADKWAKAIAIMREGLRFECGQTEYGIEVMIVDRNGSRPRQVAAEVCGNGEAFVREAVDRLIEKFHARLTPAGRPWLPH
jgi:hypothetical protein